MSVMSRVRPVLDEERTPCGDPPRDYWTMRDLAVVFTIGLERLRKQCLPEWEARDFPKHLPWSRQEKRWNPQAVLKWKAREELRAGATPPELEIRQGGKS